MRTLISVGFIFFATNIFCQTTKTDSQRQQALDSVVVTTKSNLKNINTARSIETITSNTLQANGSNTLHSALNTASGVYMVDMGNEQHAMSIRLPINYSPLYNYLENGIPVRPVGIFNNNELLELNRFSINKIEIVKGTFSGSCGAQSIGASINFLQNNYENAVKQIGLQSNGFGQWEAIAQHKFMLGKFKTLININHSQRVVDDIYHFNYSKQAASIRLEKTLKNGVEMVFQSNISNYVGDQRNGYDSSQFYGQKFASNDRFSDRKTLAIRNTLEFKRNINNYDNISLTFFNRIVNEEQNPFYLISYSAPYSGRITKDKFWSVGYNANYNNTSKDGKLKLNAAAYFDITPNNTFKGNFIWVQKDANFVNVSFTNPDSLVTDYTAKIYNAALSSSLTYLPNTKWIFTAGLRYDNVNYNYTNHLPIGDTSGPPSNKTDLNALNPELSVLYKLSNNQSVYAQYSSGFTPPTLSNLFRDGKSTKTLNSAKYYNIEVGYKFFTKNFNLQFCLYNINGEDEFISEKNSNGIIDVVNAGKTKHQGMELKLCYAKNDFEINYNGSFAKHTYLKYQRFDWGGNKIVYDGNDMIGAPNYTHYANVGYSFGESKNIKVLFEWNKAGTYKIDYENKYDYEGYDLFNLKSTLSLNKFFINVGVNNVFNVNYATVADGTFGFRNYYPGIRRTLQVGMAYRF